MNITTHRDIDQKLCGTPIFAGNGKSSVRLRTEKQMSADDTGLVHGGFVFGMADYAAMLAVNHPHVVLGSAETRFLKPVRVGEILEAHASVEDESGKKRHVAVSVFRDDTEVFTGNFLCFVLEEHPLAPQK